MNIDVKGLAIIIMLIVLLGWMTQRDSYDHTDFVIKSEVMQ